MAYTLENPLIVQSDMSILLETTSPLFVEARDFLSTFAELRKSPEYIHTYEITRISIWNAASAGLTAEMIIDGLRKYSKYDIPSNVITEIIDTDSRFGKIKLTRSDGDRFKLICDNPLLQRQIIASTKIKPYILSTPSKTEIELVPNCRGLIKQEIIKLGYPVEDLAGFTNGAALPFELRKEGLLTKVPFALRDYQQECVDIFAGKTHFPTGNGVIVLPCGAGKTLVGIGCMQALQQHTLILTTNVTALRQWRQELLDKTTLTEDQIGEYSGEIKDIKPVTLTTFQIMTFRKTKTGPFLHMDLFRKHEWGLIIYDEVHILPAPVFRATTEVQARRRIGLTATLVREDHREEDVFTLIGPKRYDKPWKDLEQKGFIATARCVEIRLPMPEALQIEYAVSPLKNKYRIAMENPFKVKVTLALLKKHKDDQILIIGQYLDQLESIRKETGAPIITGDTPNATREKLYNDFRNGVFNTLIVSKVANYAVDLPEASVAIQVSGTYGSRQEETQRLGRILRPKQDKNLACFYSLVTSDTTDQDCARNRSLFLTEQGYQYRIIMLNETQLQTCDPSLFDIP